MRILLIEDDVLVREVMTEMLTSEGHTVLPATDGQAALVHLANGNPVDLVLTDLKMPGMSGWEVVRAIKEGWPDLPVGIITGTPKLLSEERETVDLVIHKPVGLDALRNAISRLGPRSPGGGP